jgi:hypothetical protein
MFDPAHLNSWLRHWSRAMEREAGVELLALTGLHPFFLSSLTAPPPLLLPHVMEAPPPA